jgi:hypothetical protein
MKSKLLISLALIVVTVTAVLSLFLNMGGSKEIVVTHGVVSPTSTIGSGIGTVRTFNIPIIVDGVSEIDNYLVGTLSTLAEGVKGDQELRSSNLIFVFKEEANQIVLGGISLYPAAGATIAIGVETIRPIIGGSGTYEGVTGQVVSKNLGDDGWSHVLQIKLP